MSPSSDSASSLFSFISYFLSFILSNSTLSGFTGLSDNNRGTASDDNDSDIAGDAFDDPDIDDSEGFVTLN